MNLLSREWDARFRRWINHWSAIVLLLLAVAALATQSLGDAIWFDEMRTLYYAGAPTYGEATHAELIERISANRYQAPLYFLVLHHWGTVAGWAVTTMRLPSLWFGMLTIAVTYQLVRRYFSPSVAFYTVFTLSMSVFFINYLHEMRTYTLITLFTILLAWCYVRLMCEEDHTPLSYAMLALYGTALMYTHYYAALPLIGLGLYHLLFHFRQPRYLPTLVALALPAILFLPWLGTLLGGLELAVTDERVIENMTLLEVLNNVGAMFANGNAALVLLLVLWAIPETDRQRRFVWFWLLASLMIAFLATRFFPILTEVRYLIFLWPLLGALVGLGISHLVGLGLSPVIILTVWSVFLVRGLNDPTERLRVHPYYTPPLHELANTLEGRVGTNDTVMFVMPPDFPPTFYQSVMDYYLDGLSTDNPPVGRFLTDEYATTDAAYQAAILDIIDETQPDRLWMAYEPAYRHWRVGPIENDILPQAGYAHCGLLTESEALHAVLFAHADADDANTVVFDEGEGTIDVSVLNTAAVGQNGALEVNVTWEAPPAVDTSKYSIGFYLFDSAGTVTAQIDMALQPGFNCHYGRFLVDPDETYTLRTAIYQWETGERLLTANTQDDLPAIVDVTQTVP